MLIKRKLMSKVEKYFIINPKNVKFGTDYDERIYKIVEKIIKIYKQDPEKSLFIEKGLIEQQPWSLNFRDKFHIERRTYFAWKEEILRDTVICAALQGLIVLDINDLVKDE